MNVSAAAVPSIAIPGTQPHQVTKLPAGQPALPALVLFGLDDRQKPHASWFNASEAEKAKAAATVMGMYALATRAGDLGAIAAKLPRGKLFASGKAFVPFVNAATYEQLVKHLPKGTRARLRVVAGTAAAPVKPPTELTGDDIKPGTTWDQLLPNGWGEIKEGNLVLASEKVTLWDGWFEAFVVEVRPNDMFWLKWRYWPEVEKFARHRSHIALLHRGPKADI